MDRAYKISLVVFTIIVSFLSIAISSDGRATRLGNQNPKSGNKGETWSKGEDQNTIPGGITIDDPFDPYGPLAPMYFPASAAGFQDMGIVKDGHRSVDGVNGGRIFNGYLQGYDGALGGDYGFPYPGGFGFPPGIFGLPRFQFPGGIFRFPRGFPGGISWFPGGDGWFPGGYGGNSGGYGGNPGGSGHRGPGDRHGGGGYSGSGGKTQVKGKEVSPHD